MNENIVYLPSPDLAPWQLASHGDGQPAFVKELIYAGKFRMGNGVEFEVDKPLLQHWASTFASMDQNGVKVPLPIEHTEDPEKNRGRVTGLYVENNSRGLPALFGKIQFRDNEAAELAKTAQVSIFSPPEFVDGKGNRYRRPIKHVALTDYPVIPALQGFQSIAASLVTTDTKDMIMPLKKLATSLGIQIQDETKLEETIVASFKSASETIVAKDKEIEALKAKIPVDPVAVTVSAAHRNMLRDNRDMKLSILVGKGLISPAVKEDLVKGFCTDDSLTLALSSSGTTDPFDLVVAALSKNVTVPLGDEAVVVLSKGKGGDEENVLLKDMKKRAEAKQS